MGVVGRARLGEDDRRGVAGDGEAERLEQPGEGAVELVAPAAAAVAHDLAVVVLGVEHVSPAQVQIEVLERHRQHVRPVQAGERVGARLERAVVPDPGQVLADIHLRLRRPCAQAGERRGPHSGRIHVLPVGVDPPGRTRLQPRPHDRARSFQIDKRHTLNTIS
jgi:hypothetical protein